MTDIDYSPTLNPEFIGDSEPRPYDAFEQARDEADLDHMEQMDNEPEDSMTDVEADADTLASAGMGTDEDYGFFGDCGGED
jgi:hypothetical protein